jgi:hypothetical protein
MNEHRRGGGLKGARLRAGLLRIVLRRLKPRRNCREFLPFSLPASKKFYNLHLSQNEKSIDISLTRV